jgi:hypothetical protein
MGGKSGFARRFIEFVVNFGQWVGWVEKENLFKGWSVEGLEGLIWATKNPFRVTGRGEADLNQLRIRTCR